jgi:hypothetical protein
LGDLLWEGFLKIIKKISPHFWATLSHLRFCIKSEILGDFFTNSSGRPVDKPLKTKTDTAAVMCTETN